MKRILCISHDATMTGAPKLLLNLIGILKQHDVKVNVLVKNGFHSNSLSKQFEKVSQEYGTYFRNGPKNLLSKIRNRFIGAPKPDIRPLLDQVDFILNNTITNGDILPEIRRYYPGPIITYVHELEVACQTYTTPDLLKNTLQYSDLFLVPCESVKLFLTNKLGVDIEKISVLNYYIELPEPEVVSSHNQEKNEYIVGGCGTLDWRKGADVFVQVARAFIQKFPESKTAFRWKGAVVQSTDYRRIVYDLEKLGLINKVELIESSLETDDFYNKLDLFLLTSREDPYPLVVLEAAAHKVPTVCFSGSGGASEFTGDDAGDIVSYLSVSEMVEAIARHQEDFDMTRRKGERAAQKLQSLHQDAQLVIDQLKSAYKRAALFAAKA